MRECVSVNASIASVSDQFRGCLVPRLALIHSMRENKIYNSIFQTNIILIQMRAFVSALLATAALAADREKPKGAYDYTEGGDNWSQLAIDDNMCGKPDHPKQSPILLFDSEAADTKPDDKKLFKDRDMSISIPPMGANIVPKIDLTTNQYAINWYHGFSGWNDDKSSSFRRVTAENEPTNFYPAQIHWHTPSEHATADVKDGTPVYYAAEAHIVNVHGDGDKYGVLGIFFDVPENA